MRRSTVGVLLVLCLSQLVGSLVHAEQQDSSVGTPGAPSVEETQGTARDIGRTKLDVAWQNKSVTLDVANVEVHDVMRALSEKSGVEIAVAATVTGKVTLRATNAPLEKVVDDLLAAVGQRNYLMVFDGGDLTKMSVVPKDGGGKGLGEQAKRVKMRGKLRPETVYRESKGVYKDKDGKVVTGNLRTGKEIEYYPGEIIVTTGRALRPSPREPADAVERFVAKLENKYGLALIKRTKLYFFEVFKFRVLNGRDPVDVIYEMGETQASGIFSLNGIGPRSVEFPEEDFNVYRYLTRAEIDECWSRRVNTNLCQMEKMPFLKAEPLKGSRPFPYMEGLFLEGGYSFSQISRQMGLANDEGALIVGTGYESYLFFPNVHGPKETVAVWDKFHTQPMFWRPAQSEACRPNDTLYPAQWNLRRIRAEGGWEIESGSRDVKLGVVDKDFDKDHPDFGARLSPESAECIGQDRGLIPLGIGTANLVDGGSTEPGHGSRVAGIAGAITNNGAGIAGIAGSGCDANKGVTLLGLQVDVDAKTAELAFWYAGGLLFSDGAEYLDAEPQIEKPWEPLPNSWQACLVDGGNHAWTDSPSGNYDDNVSTALTYKARDLRGSEGLALRLSLRAKWALAEGDTVTVETSDDDGANWSVLGMLSGTASTWQTKTYDLTFSPGSRPEKFRIRFRLAGNGDGVTADGVYIDDVEIQVLDASGQPKRKADVLNASIDLFGDPAYVLHAMEAAYAKGVSLVLAAGNAMFSQGSAFATVAAARQGLPTPPGIDEKLLIVAATDRDDHRPEWSNYGGIVDVSAPGVEILSTTEGGAYTSFSSPDTEVDGTSYAAPHVAALASLLVSRDPSMTPQAVYDRIKSTADPLTETGMGAGRINMYSALRGSRDEQPPGRPTDGRLIRGSGNVRVTWGASSDNDAIGEYAVLRREFSGVSCADPVSVDGGNYCQLALVFPDGTNSSSYESSLVGGVYSITDDDLVEGEWYGYRLIAYDKTGNASEPTDEMDTLPPEKPTDSEVLGGNGKAKFTWTAPSWNADGSTPVTDLDGYRVYFDTAPTYSHPSTRWTGDESVELTGLANGTTYFVCVKAVDTTGNESACSETVTVKPEDAIWVHASGGPSGAYARISDALAAASKGDTIMVGPGVYQESELLVGGEGSTEWDPWDVTLRSERGPGETIIEGDGSQAFVLSMADRTRIIGFTIGNGGNYGIYCWFGEDVLVANNILMANDVGVYVGGTPWEAGRLVRIYNNVFIGNIRSARGIQGAQFYSENDLSIDIKNNIFQGVSGQGAVGISLSYCENVVIEHNDFSGLTKAIVTTGGSDGNDKPSQRSNFTFSPGFLSFSAVDPEDGDYHLADGSPSRDAGSTSLSYDGQAWEDCDGTRTDLGAYGGPFAYVDNDPPESPWHGIPDCMQPKGRNMVAAVMTNTADAPMTLRAQNQTADLAYRVVDQPVLGAVTGVAPDLRYSSGAIAGQDGLTFKVSNAMGESDPALVDIRVKSSNVPPAAVDQTVRMSKNEIGAVVLQGTDADGDALTFVVDSSPSPLAISCPDPPTCYLLPTDGFEGTTSFAFHANDGFADSAPATVTVAVGPVFLFLAPGESDVRTNADTFTVAWSDDPAGSRLISLYAGGEVLAADVLESDASNSYTADISTLPDGKYEVSAVLDDGILFEEISAKGFLHIDRTGPLVRATPAGGVCRGFGEVQLLASEDAIIYYTLDGSEPSVASATYTTPIYFTSDQTIRFIAVDDLGNSSEMMEEVYMVHHAPTDMGLSATTIPENRAAGTTVGTLSTTDADVGDTFTYKVLAQPGTDYGSFQISGDQLLAAITFDYEGQQSYTVMVLSTDSDGYWTWRTFTIAVSDVNEAPVFTAGSDQVVSEDAGLQDAVGWATGISGGPGESGQAVDFMVTNDNPSLFAAQPAISASGTLSYVPAADAHGSAIVTVRLHDSGGTAGGGVDTSDPQSFTIAVTSVNDNPADIVLWYDSVSKIAAAGTLVGTLSTTDADVGDVFTYALTPGAGDNASFEIIGNELRVLVPLDFTVTNPYSVHVRSTDLAGASIEEVFSVFAPAASVLWTRNDTGQAASWTIDPTAASGSPKLIPISELASLHSTSGIGGPWEATSYEYVSATEAYVLWTRGDTGQAVLWKIDPSAASGMPKVIPISELASIHSTSGIGGPWRATSYAYASATEGYVLWTRSDTGQGVLWKIDPSAASGTPRVMPRVDMASLQSTTGVGSQWQASSYEHVSATEGYVLWTRSDTGRGVLWKIDPSAGSGSPKIIPVSDLASLQSTSGIGSPWQATSYEYISPTEAYVLWTRSDTGQAVQWRIDPSAAAGSPKIIPVSELASLYSTSGIGGPWQATSYFRIGQVREGTEQEFNPIAPEGAGWFGTGVETGVQTGAETGVEIGIEWMMGIWNGQEFQIAQ